MKKLGTGVLGWDKHERVSDRYGRIYLRRSPESDEDELVELTHLKCGVRGRLIAIVKEIRPSRYIGDLFHGVSSKTPKVGQKIILGEGKLFFRNYYDGAGEYHRIGLQPDDGRETLWLNIRALYKASDQTITLYFEKFPTNK